MNDVEAARRARRTGPPTVARERGTRGRPHATCLTPGRHGRLRRRAPRRGLVPLRGDCHRDSGGWERVYRRAGPGKHEVRQRQPQPASHAV